jgi:hypothetical protein
MSLFLLQMQNTPENEDDYSMYCVLSVFSLVFFGIPKEENSKDFNITSATNKHIHITIKTSHEVTISHQL